MNIGPAELIWLGVPLLVAALLAVIPARIASRKGYSFAAFYVFAVFLWLVALVVALVISPKTDGLGEGQLLGGQRL